MAIGITGANNGYSRKVADERFIQATGDTVSGNLTVTGTLSTTLLEALSANITVIDIKQYELSGFNVQGNATVQGSVSATGNITVNQRLNFAGDSSGTNNMSFYRVGSNNWNWDTSGVGTVANLNGNVLNFQQDLVASRAGIVIRNIGEATGIRLLGEAPHVLAQRTGTSPQESRIYSTYTDASNYERFFIKTNVGATGATQIGLSAAGSGQNRDLEFVVGGSTRMEISSGGNVGIGTTSPNEKLTVVGNISATGNINSITVGLGSGSVATNTALGSDALAANTTGLENVAVGYRVMVVNTTGSGNCAVGTAAMIRNTTGSGNTALGQFALFENLSAEHNTALGSRALLPATGGSNTAVGRSSLGASTTGTSNTAIGIRSGFFIADNVTANAITNNSVYLGAETKALASGQTNQIVIGYSATGLGSNTAVLGNDSIVTTALKGNVGIGTTSPAVKLDVVGSIRVSSGEAYKSAGDLYLDAANNASTYFRDGSTVNAVITNTGNVGIGTTSPAYALEVKSAGSIVNIGGGILYLKRDLTDLGGRRNWGIITESTLGDFSIRESAANNTAPSVPRLHISSGGNVGIGTTSPASKLTVTGGDIEATDSASGIILKSPNGTRYRITVDDSGALTSSSI